MRHPSAGVWVVVRVGDGAAECVQPLADLRDARTFPLAELAKLDTPRVGYRLAGPDGEG